MDLVPAMLTELPRIPTSGGPRGDVELVVTGSLTPERPAAGETVRDRLPVTPA